MTDVPGSLDRSRIRHEHRPAPARGARASLFARRLALGLVVALAPAFGLSGRDPRLPDRRHAILCGVSFVHAARAISRARRAIAQPKEVAAQKHIAAIMSGGKSYTELAAADRAKLAELIKAVDAASTIVLEFPPSVAPGETFQVTAKLTGGSGPAVGVGLVDRAHRWWSRPASSVGWEVVGAPTIIGPSGSPQSDWLSRRPERKGRNITFVNVTDWKSSAETQTWASAKVIFTLRAPEKSGDYPLVGFYLYGTEKATVLGTTPNAMYGDQPLGGYTGKSGRVKFTPAHVITVK